MGLRGSPTHGVTYDNVRVPLGNLVGPEGRGLQQTLDVGNPAGLRLYAELRGFFDRKNDESGIGDFLRGTPTAAIQPAAITWSEVAQIEEAEELDEDES